MELSITVIIASILLLIGGYYLLHWLEKQGLADWGGTWLNRLNGLNRVFCCKYHRLQGEISSLPKEGAAVLVSNHHSGLDPILLIAASPRPLRFLIAEEEYNRFGLTWLFKAVGCIPVNRKERPERAFRHALKVLQQGEVVALFPHGKIRLDHEPSKPLKAGAAHLAKLAGCDVIPARIDGIRGKNQVIMSVLMRSHAVIHSAAPIKCDTTAIKSQCLKSIQEYIEYPQS